MKKLSFWLILLAIVFLAGFIPQYLRTNQAKNQAAAVGDQLRSCESTQQVSQMRQNLALAYLQATQKNYGVASDYAGRFFNQAQSLENTTADASLRNLLQGVLSSRNQITADLAQGNEGVVAELQPLVQKIEQGPAQ
jgi:hypothetical protein